MRHATKLDKVRWIIICSSDLLLLLGLFGVFDLYLRWESGKVAAPVAAVAAVGVVAVTALTSRGIRLAIHDEPRPTRLLAVAGGIVLALAAFPIIWVMPLWLAMAAPFIRRRTLILLSLASIALAGAKVALDGGIYPVVLAVHSVFTVFVVGGILANLWLWGVARQAHEGPEARARLAVSEERLRFARDLNDLLGQSLTGIAARTASAEETLRADQRAAAAKMFEVRDLSRQALREVRATVQSYRTLDFDEVLSSVRAVLEAADVRCSVNVHASDLPAETRTLLAWVVREGATNVLKHSRAEHCTITIDEGILEMVNDGVSGPANEHAPNGLGGLAQRVGTAGGTLTAAPTPEGGYVLRVVVPA